MKSVVLDMSATIAIPYDLVVLFKMLIFIEIIVFSFFFIIISIKLYLIKTFEGWLNYMILDYKDRERLFLIIDIQLIKNICNVQMCHYES